MFLKDKNNINFKSNDNIVSGQAIDINKYKDSEGLSLKKITFGLWFVKNKYKLRFILISFLIIISVLSWGNFTFNFGKYVFFDMKKDDNQITEIINTNTIDHAYLQSKSAQDLLVSSVYTFKASDTNDYMVKVKNQNNDYWAKFDYCFFDDENNKDCKNLYILPSENKRILLLRSSVVKSNSPKFEISNIKWQKINKHLYPDWEGYYNEHLNFEISNINISSNDAEETGRKFLNFGIKNNTPYNYWNAGLNIGIFRGNDLVEVNYYQVSEFLSGQEKNVNLPVSNGIGVNFKVEIIPELNVFDENNYIKFEGGVGGVK